MSADAAVYCLERVTDYRDFERLCSALMAGAGYPCLMAFLQSKWLKLIRAQPYKYTYVEIAARNPGTWI